MSKNTTSQGYIVLLISVSLLIIIQAMAIGRDSNSLERPVLSVSTTFMAPEFALAAPATPFVPDHFEPGALSPLPGEDEGGMPITGDDNCDGDPEDPADTETSEPTMSETNPGISMVIGEALINDTLQNHEQGDKQAKPASNQSQSVSEKVVAQLPVTENHVSYTIKKGDSLWLIANIYKTTVSKLMKWNGIDPNDSLHPGRKLKIPGNKAEIIHKREIAKNNATKTLPISSSSKSKKSVTYRVQKGDNLIGIAKKFHTSVASLLISNNIDDPGKLRLGQLLKISEAAEIIHVVTKGESLWELGKLYSIKLSKIIEHNHLKYRTIFPGQKITIPVHNAVKLEEIYKKRKQKRLNSKFRSPLKGRLCGYYGWRIHPILKKRLFHCGVDIAAPQGTSINAIGAGKVTFAGWLKGYGKVVVVKHGRGLSSRYAHCHTIKTKVGAKIKAGQTIAKVGTTGLSTGPHLHLEVRKFGHPVDPRKFVAI